MKIAYNGYLYESKNAPSVDDLRKKYEQDPNVYFSYRSINKIGINPKSKWDTPNGIYCYNVEDMEGKVPEFQSEASNGYVYFIKAKPNAVKLDLQRYNKENLITDLEKLRQLGFSSLEMHDIERGALFKTPGGYIWYATREYSTSPNKWNALIRKLGYDYVVDHYKGIIHTNEPSQTVFLTSSAYTILEATVFNKKIPDISYNTKVDLFNYIKYHPNDYSKITNEQIHDALYNSGKEKILKSFDEIPKFYEYKLNQLSFFDMIPDNYKVEFASKFHKLLSHKFSNDPHCMFGLDANMAKSLIGIFNDELQQLSEKYIYWITELSGYFKFDEYLKIVEDFQILFEYGIENNATADDIITFILAPTSYPTDEQLHMDNVSSINLRKLIHMFKGSLIQAEDKLHWIEDQLSSDIREEIKRDLEI